MRSIGITEILLIAATVAVLVGEVGAQEAEPPDADLDSVSDAVVSRAFMQRPPLLWTTDLVDDVLLQIFLPDGKLLVVTDSGGCAALNVQDGTVVWSIKDIGGMTSAKFVAIPGTDFGCLFEGKTWSEYNRNSRSNFDHFYNGLSVINYSDGRVMWTSDKLGFASVHGFFYLPPVKALMLYGRDTGKATWTVAVSVESGLLLWRNDSLFGSEGAELLNNFPASDDVLNGQQIPIFDTDSTMILLMDKEAIRKVDLRTGSVVWKVPVRVKELSAPSRGYALAVLSPDKGTAYFPIDKGVMAVRTASGQQVWDSITRLSNRPYQIEFAEKGLIIRGGPNPEKEGGHDYLSYVDTANGKYLWKQAFTEAKHLYSSDVVLRSEQAFLFADRKLWKITLADGSYSESKKIKFKTLAASPQIELRDSCFLINSANSVGMMTLNGDTVFASTFKAPGITFGQFMGAFAVGFMSGMMSGMMSAALTPGYTYYVYPTGYYGAGPAVATSVVQNHVYILTNVRDETGRKPGLVKVNRLTGRAERGIKLGDRSPLYTVDQDQTHLYYVRDDHRIECYAF